MNEIIVVITTSLLLVLAIEFYRIYKLRMLLHPGFYFMSIWLFAVPSNYYLTLVGYAQDPYPEYVDELNIFVAFTALIFIFIIRFGIKSISNHTVILKFGSSINLYKSIVYITFLSTIIKFILLLITVGISFNLGENRDVTISEGFRERSLNLFDYLLSYGTMLYPIVAILAGYYLGRKMQKLPTPVQSKLLITLPFIITLIQVLTIGGRNPLAVGLKYYLLGFSLSIVNSIQKKIAKKILIYCFFIILGFSSFSNYVGNQRDEVFKEDTVMELENPVLNQFAGIMAYMSSHYWGYQLRRNDSFDENNLGYGIYTFAGLFDFQLPFSSFFGINTSLQNMLDIENKLDYFYLKSNGFEGFFTTNSIYLQAVCDFGTTGIYFFIFLFVYYSHVVFLNIYKKRYIKAMDLYFFILCFTYWSSSNFESCYSSSSIFVFYIVLLLYDIINMKNLKIEFPTLLEKKKYAN